MASFSNNIKNQMNQIREWIASLNSEILLNSSSNYHDSALSAEDIVCRLLNCIFDTALFNANTISQNSAGTDLIDLENGIAIQVTKKETREKITSSIEKTEKLVKAFPSKFTKHVEGKWKFRIFFLTLNDKELKKWKEDKTLDREAPCFVASEDILDFTWLIRQIEGCVTDGEKFAKIYHECETMFGTPEQNETLKKYRVSLDNYARVMLEQSGSQYAKLVLTGDLNNTKIDLSRVYIDMPAKGYSGDENIDITKKIIKIGEDNFARKAGEKNTVNMPQFGQGMSAFLSAALYAEKKRDSGINKIVILADAGRGKSTLCQYICQMYRAAFLCQSENEFYQLMPFHSVTQIPIPTHKRYPIHIELRDYAEWVKEQKEDKSLLSYISYRMGLRKILLDRFDLERLLKAYSWLFLLDGLDEVPSTANRDEVMEQIQYFVNKELEDHNCDYVLLCTSRPQGYSGEFSDQEYYHVTLQDIDPERARSYLEKLMDIMESDPEIHDKELSILYDCLENPLQSNLMTTPLQMTIMTFIVRTGGTPPNNRYELFREYVDKVISREGQRNLLPKISNRDTWILKIHEELAFDLQYTSQSTTPEELEKRINSYLNKTFRGTDAEKKILQKKMYDAMLIRLAFIAETEPGKVEYPIRSIQEFMAAEYLIHTQSYDSLYKELRAMAPNEYWRNVFLFAAGDITKNSEFFASNFESICRNLNGQSSGLDVHNVSKAGSYLAIELLHDDLLLDIDVQDRYLSIIQELFQTESFMNDRYLTLLSELPEQLLNYFLETKIRPIMMDSTLDNKNAWSLLVYAVSLNNEVAVHILEDYYKQDVLNESSDRYNVVLKGKSKAYKYMPMKFKEHFRRYLISYSDIYDKNWLEIVLENEELSTDKELLSKVFDMSSACYVFDYNLDINSIFFSIIWKREEFKNEFADSDRLIIEKIVREVSLKHIRKIEPTFAIFIKENIRLLERFLYLMNREFVVQLYNYLSNPSIDTMNELLFELTISDWTAVKSHVFALGRCDTILDILCDKLICGETIPVSLTKVQYDTIKKISDDFSCVEKIEYCTRMGIWEWIEPFTPFSKTSPFMHMPWDKISFDPEMVTFSNKKLRYPNAVEEIPEENRNSFINFYFRNSRLIQKERRGSEALLTVISIANKRQLLSLELDEINYSSFAYRYYQEEFIIDIIKKIQTLCFFDGCHSIVQYLPIMIYDFDRISPDLVQGPNSFDISQANNDSERLGCILGKVFLSDKNENLEEEKALVKRWIQQPQKFHNVLAGLAKALEGCYNNENVIEFLESVTSEVFAVPECDELKQLKTTCIRQSYWMSRKVPVVLDVEKR